jgi:hypothetical protein
MSRISFTVHASNKSIHKSFMQRDTLVVTRSWTISLNYDIKLHDMRLAFVVYTAFLQTTSQTIQSQNILKGQVHFLKDFIKL